jgi:hypothetical protein
MNKILEENSILQTELEDTKNRSQETIQRMKDEIRGKYFLFSNRNYIDCNFLKNINTVSFQLLMFFFFFLSFFCLSFFLIDGSHRVVSLVFFICWVVLFFFKASPFFN